MVQSVLGRMVVALALDEQLARPAHECLAR
jgi:hypothetical protein